MRLVCFSDTHNQLPKNIPECGDVLIFAGDYARSRDDCNLPENEAMNRFLTFADWFSELPHKFKLLVAGNHDDILIYNYDVLKAYPSIIHMRNSGVDIEGFKFWGYDANQVYYGSALSKIPKVVDVLVSHVPPEIYGLNSGAVGDHLLGKKLKNIDTLKVVINGHFHSGGGVVKEVDGIRYCNCALSDENYQLCRSPMIIDL